MSDIDIKVSLYDRGKTREYGGVANNKTTGGNATAGATFEVGVVEETYVFPAEITGGNGPGYCYIKNHGTDTEDYIEGGHATGDYWFKLYAGDEAMIPLHDANCDTLYLKATDGAMEIEIYCQER